MSPEDLTVIEQTRRRCSICRTGRRWRTFEVVRHEGRQAVVMCGACRARFGDAPPAPGSGETEGAGEPAAEQPTKRPAERRHKRRRPRRAPLSPRTDSSERCARCPRVDIPPRGSPRRPASTRPRCWRVCSDWRPRARSTESAGGGRRNGRRRISMRHSIASRRARATSASSETATGLETEPAEPGAPRCAASRPPLGHAAPERTSPACAGPRPTA